MSMRVLLPGCSLVLVLSVTARDFTFRADHTNGVYAVGETATFTLRAADGKPGPTNVYFLVKQGGLQRVKDGTCSLAAGPATVSHTFETPGTVLVEAYVPGDGDQKTRVLAGAVADPAKIPNVTPCPPDFDAFWRAKIDELAAVPMHPVLEPGDCGNDKVDYWKVTLDNIRGTKIQGQLARPKKGDKFPALLVVQWAGVYPLDKGWAHWPAGEGFLVLNINAHDLPIDQPKAFYDEKSNGPLKNYPAQGNDDRETSYFLRMYLSCYRAADYLASRPDWDGKTLLVSGTSQGGLQTIMLAGLHPKITGGMANVPAGCDHFGRQANRAPGWPNWLSSGAGKDAKKVETAAAYYDIVNFAARIKCPMLVAMGLIDETCPPAGIFAAVNQMKGPVETVILPLSDHHGNGNTQAAYFNRYNEWRKAAVMGKALPPQ